MNPLCVSSASERCEFALVKPFCYRTIDKYEVGVELVRTALCIEKTFSMGLESVTSKLS